MPIPGFQFAGYIVIIGSDQIKLVFKVFDKEKLNIRIETKYI